MKKAGVVYSGLYRGLFYRLFGEQHVTRVLDRAGDGTLVFRGEMSVLAWQDLAGIGHEILHHFRSGERDLIRGEGLRGGFGSAHGFNLDRRTLAGSGYCQRHILMWKRSRFTGNLLRYSGPRSSNG